MFLIKSNVIGNFRWKKYAIIVFSSTVLGHALTISHKIGSSHLEKIPIVLLPTIAPTSSIRNWFPSLVFQVISLVIAVQ